MEARANDTTTSLLRPVVVSALLFMLVCGLAYPLLTTGIAALIFPNQASGSLVERDGEVFGAELIGQQFVGAEYFRPRPSATVQTGGEEDEPYNAAQSAGTNQGPTNAELISTVEERATEYHAENTLPDEALVPVDAVTASASGLDPHITPANAELQVPRVAEARGVPEEEVRRLITENTDGRLFGFVGEPGVNVLRLNLALDEEG